VKLLDGIHGVAANPVIYDPEDPDPKRRFKMAFETEKYQNALAVAYSLIRVSVKEHNKILFAEESR
jgi:hypothetical protein